MQIPGGISAWFISPLQSACPQQDSVVGLKAGPSAKGQSTLFPCSSVSMIPRYMAVLKRGLFTHNAAAVFTRSFFLNLMNSTFISRCLVSFRRARWVLFIAGYIITNGGESVLFSFLFGHYELVLMDICFRLGRAPVSLLFHKEDKIINSH